MELRDFVEYSKGTVLPIIIIDKNYHVVFANQCAAKNYPEICYDEGIELLIPYNMRDGFLITAEVASSYRFCGYGPFVNTTFVITAVCGEYFAISPVLPLGADTPEKQKGKDILQKIDYTLRIDLSSISIMLPKIARVLTENNCLSGIPFLDVVNQSTYKMARNISNLVQYKEFTEGYCEMTFSDFYIDDLVFKVVNILNGLLKDTNLKIKFRKQAEFVYVNGDYHRIVLALIQLISNAMKYSACEGEIEIELTTKGKNVVISVIDKGFGMPSKVLKSCRTAFYGYNHDGKASDGTGLGLTIAEFIAGKHYGKIDISSRLSEGTTAKLILPIGESSVIYMKEPATIKPDATSILIALADVINIPTKTSDLGGTDFGNTAGR